MGGHLLQRTGRTGLGGTGSPAQGVFGASCKANGGPSSSENRAHLPGGDGEPCPGGVRSLLQGQWGAICGVVWCGVVWCGVVWCGVVWCGVLCCVVLCCVVWCCVVLCCVVLCCVVLCCVVLCSALWCIWTLPPPAAAFVEQPLPHSFESPSPSPPTSPQYLPSDVTTPASPSHPSGVLLQPVCLIGRDATTGLSTRPGQWWVCPRATQPMQRSCTGTPEQSKTRLSSGSCCMSGWDDS